MTKPKRPQQQYLSRVLHYKLHRRSLLAVFVLLMVLFASIGFLLYSEFSNYANSQTASYATDLMAQQVNSTQNLWEEMDALSSSIQADQNISAFFTARKSDLLTNYHAFRSLGRYKVLHPFIQNISLYNVTTGKQLNLLYYAREETAWNDEEIARGSTFSVPRMVTSPGLGETAVLTLVYPIRSYSNSYTCCIAIDIQRSHLQTMLTRSAGSHTYILGESNQLLVQPVDGYLPAEWGQVLSGLYQAGPEQGSFYQQLDGQKNLVSYCKFPTQAWTVVSIQPARGLLSAARSKIIMLVLFLLALLILSMGTMFILLLRIYRPIDDLVSQLPHESDAVVDEMAVISNELTVYRDRSDMMKQSLYQSNLQSLLFGLPCDRVELPASITQSERFVVGVLSHTKKTGVHRRRAESSGRRAAAGAERVHLLPVDGLPGAAVLLCVRRRPSGGAADGADGKILPRLPGKAGKRSAAGRKPGSGNARAASSGLQRGPAAGLRFLLSSGAHSFHTGYGGKMA